MFGRASLLLIAAFILIVVIISFMIPEQPKVRVRVNGAVVVPVYNPVTKHITDSFPYNASKITSLGNEWFSFEMDGKKFMCQRLGPHNSSGKIVNLIELKE